jgi:hypothetical protein
MTYPTKSDLERRIDDMEDDDEDDREGVIAWRGVEGWVSGDGEVVPEHAVAIGFTATAPREVAESEGYHIFNEIETGQHDTVAVAWERDKGGNNGP